MSDAAFDAWFNNREPFAIIRGEGLMSKACAWRPIETAPKDVPVLLYQAPKEPFEDAGYLSPDEPRMIVGMLRADSYLYGRVSTCNIYGYECECEVDKPTHWMPLPSPP